MQLTALITDPLRPDVIRQAGGWILVMALGFGLLITVYLTAFADRLLVPFAALMVAGVGGVILFRNPLLNLTGVILGFLAIIGFEDGIQVSEVLYGLYYLAFLGHWYGTRIFLYKDPLFDTREARVLFLFLVLATASIGLTLLHGGSIRFYIGEWLSLSFLALYFPVREAVTRHKNGLYVVMGAVLLLALYVVIKNTLQYQQILIEAAYAWQVTRGRATTQTAVIIVPLFAGLMYFLHARDRKAMLASACVFAVFFAGLIISQSRGYWMAFVAACLVLLPFMPARQRLKLVGTGALAVVGVLLVGYLVLGDVFVLVATGLLDRVLSIGSAATDDISLINRFRETAVVMEKVWANPILGYGMGVPFRFWDLTFLPPFHHVTTFLHNGYVALWYKFGIWGLGMMMFFWWSSIWRALKAYRATGPLLWRTTAGAVAGIMLSYSVAAITSNPFYINDPMMMIGIMTGLVAGISQLLSAQPQHESASEVELLRP